MEFDLSVEFKIFDDSLLHCEPPFMLRLKSLNELKITDNVIFIIV